MTHYNGRSPKKVVSRHAKRVWAEKLAAKFKLGKRRVCRLVSLSLSTASYRRRKRPDADERLIERMKELAEKHPRHGLWMIHRILVAEGLVVNIKRTARIYRQLGLQLVNRRKRQRKYQPKVRGRRPQAIRPHHRWAIDFVHDALVSGWRLKILSAVDEYTRQSVRLGVDLRIDGVKATAMLDEAAAAYGCYPQEIRCDNGSEFSGDDFRQWALDHGIRLLFIEPGKPTQNAICESFNGRFRDEFLSINRFSSLAMAQVMAEDWRGGYNNERPHSGLGGLPPAQFAKNWRLACTARACA